VNPAPAQRVAGRAKGAGSVDLRPERQVGAHSKRNAPPACRILEPPQLDDGAWTRVTGGVEIGQADVVGVTVHAIYHRVAVAFSS